MPGIYAVLTLSACYSLSSHGPDDFIDCAENNGSTDQVVFSENADQRRSRRSTIIC